MVLWHIYSQRFLYSYNDEFLNFLNSSIERLLYKNYCIRTDVSEVGSGFEYNRAGFAYDHVPKAILLFQVQLDELYLMVQSDFS